MANKLSSSSFSSFLILVPERKCEIQFPAKRQKGPPSLPKPSLLLPRFTFYRLSTTREENDLVRKSRISFQFHSHLQKHQQQQSPDLLVHLHSRGKLFCQLFLFYCDLSLNVAPSKYAVQRSDAIDSFTVNGYTFDDSNKSNL